MIINFFLLTLIVKQMNRNEFIKKTAASFVVLNSLSVFDLFSSTMSRPSTLFDESELAKLDDSLRAEFTALVKWLKDNKWEAFLLKNINQTTISWNENIKLCSELSNITRTKENGFDDFGGNKLIELGNPSLSLLYHALASPRVKDKSILAYPSIEQLDTLENFIYGLKKWEDYSLPTDKKNLHLMVLAYEYRPAFKTPTFDPNHRLNNNKYAQLVYSRTGIARIGNKDYNYDLENRCFTNLPIAKKDEKQIAITPARYGLFLVELATVSESSNDSIKLMNYQDVEKTNLGDRHFIKPVRKLFNNSLYNIEFAEYHLNEKLYKLTQFDIDGEKFEFPVTADINSAPFRRVNCSDDTGTILSCNTTNESMVSLVRVGNSILLSSTPNELVRKATQNGKYLYFKVTPKWEENHLSNRRYAAFKVTDKKSKDVNDAVWTDFIYRRDRRTSRFRAPKNAPLFLNIKYQVQEDGNNEGIHIDNNLLEKTICDGNYFAQLFEDSICEGSISAKIIYPVVTDSRELKIQSYLKNLSDVLPAFSLVTAPDFFPYMDSNDIRSYYFNNRYITDGHFLEGGTINLSGIRQRGNPQLKDPFTGQVAFKDSYLLDKSFDTLMAVVSNTEKSSIGYHREYAVNYCRDYKSTSFLPDTGTGIFFPGWDVTYSSESKDGIRNPFLATIGLGSPFPEDMKLCAAANGMWPVASPDAGRTFQGSLEPFPLLGKPSTSVPLMDDEIGLHANSPHVIEHGQTQCYGWDGEQGPFLKKDKTTNKVFVNFTDIGKADYVENILDPTIGFDMSKLRGLESEQLIRRMDSLKDAIRKISPNRRKKKRLPEFTKYWLVGAEIVQNWQNGANAYCIPNTLIGTNNNWAKQPEAGLSGSGYLFAFVITKDKKKCKDECKVNCECKCVDNDTSEYDNTTSKRRNQEVEKIAICKVAKQDLSSQTNIKWVLLKTNNLPNDGNEITEWKD